MASGDSLEWIVSALSRPGTLPGRDADAPVETRSTHASVVLVAGTRAWKLKRRVNLGFMDFTTLEAREANARAELRLNRRLAPEIYRDVWAIVRRGDGVVLVERPAVGDEALDWAVEMLRLPAEGMLDRMLTGSGVDRGLLERFAVELATFHAAHPVPEEYRSYGSMPAIERRVRDNLARLRTHACEGSAPMLPDDFVAALDRAAMAWLTRLRPELERRAAEGRVREGHGDLHAGNLCVVDGRLVAYDCLEFEPAFRCSDVASEVAFLAMDLDVRGRPDLAEAFVNAYIAASGDHGLRGVERFFRLHYAVIRAMVDAIRRGQAERDGDARAALARSVEAYAAWGAGYAVEPALVILSGLPATGKSTLARAVARPLRAAVVRSDEVRKRLAGLAPTARGAASIYGAEATAATYDRVAEEARSHLVSRRSVVVDAANLKRGERARFIDLGRALQVRWLIVETSADETVIRERMRLRAHDASEPSDATIEVYERLRAGAEPPTEVPPGRLLRTAGDRPIWDALRRLLDEPGRA